jgi:hypothetical protein
MNYAVTGLAQWKGGRAENVLPLIAGRAEVVTTLPCESVALTVPVVAKVTSKSKVGIAILFPEASTA